MRSEHQIPLFLALRREGADLGIRCAGMRALGSLRLEKGFAGWGRELSPDYDPFQAGLGRFVKLDKDEFVGYLTSAGYGHCAGRTLALGYVRSDAIASNAAYDVEVIGEPRPARRLDRPPIDPDGERMRG